MKPHIRFKSGYKYQLVADYKVYVKIFPDEDISTHFLTLAKKGLLTIRHGYACDGPSGITIDTKSFMRAAFVHDSLYQLIRVGLLEPRWRLEADQELQRVCLEDGMYSWRAWYVYKAVRWFGGSAASPENKKKVFTAP